jgi:dephospho-CoA kinase
MYTIGVTGNIASGKTTVTRLLKRELGGMIIDADEVLKEITRPDSPTWKKIVALFGQDVIQIKSKELHRQKIAELVFRDREKLLALEKITHPAIVSNIKAKINAIRKKLPEATIIIEAIKLLDSTLAPLVSAVVLVRTKRERQFDRLMIDRQYSMPQALMRIEAYEVSQQHEGITLSIDNYGDLGDLEAKVKDAVVKLREQLSS